MQRGIIIGAESNIASAVRHLLEDVIEIDWEVCSEVSGVNNEVFQSASMVVFNFLEEDDSLNKLLAALRIVPSSKLVVFGYVDEEIFIKELCKIGVQYYLPFNSSRLEVGQAINQVLATKAR